VPSSTKLAAADALYLASAKNASAALATFDIRLAEALRGQASKSRRWGRAAGEELGPARRLPPGPSSGGAFQIVFDFIWSAI
jgi:hypothetical protein